MEGDFFLEQRVRLGKLFDLYGELLTEKQCEICGELLREDLSFGELAENFGITRQGAFSQVDKARAKMEKFESAAGALRLGETLEAVRALTKKYRGRLPEEYQTAISHLLEREDASDV